VSMSVSLSASFNQLLSHLYLLYSDLHMYVFLDVRSHTYIYTYT